MKTLFKPILGGICVAAMLMAAGSAQAITIDLNQANDSITGPYGYVTVDLINSTTANIKFTALNGYVFLDGQAADVNVNGQVTVSVDSPFAATIDYTEHAAPVDGFGGFNVQVTEPTASADMRFSTISFTLSNTSGTWSSADSVLVANGKGNLVGAHIALGSGALTYKAAGNGNPWEETPVPDGGATIALLGFALCGVDYLRRRIVKA